MAQLGLRDGPCSATHSSGGAATGAARARGRPRRSQPHGRGQRRPRRTPRSPPAAARLARPARGPGAGGRARADAGGRALRPRPRPPLLDLRDVVDPRRDPRGRCARRRRPCRSPATTASSRTCPPRSAIRSRTWPARACAAERARAARRPARARAAASSRCATGSTATSRPLRRRDRPGARHVAGARAPDRGARARPPARPSGHAGPASPPDGRADVRSAPCPTSPSPSSADRPPCSSTAACDCSRTRRSTTRRGRTAATARRRCSKTEGPAITADQIGDVDVVLISHDHHPDNLDESGRAYLPRAGRVITTAAGAERLGGDAIGLEPWAGTEVGAITVTAVPAQHGPDGTDHLTGPVIGFVLEAQGLPRVYVSGDNASVPVVETHRRAARRHGAGRPLRGGRLPRGPLRRRAADAGRYGGGPGRARPGLARRDPGAPGGMGALLGAPRGAAPRRSTKRASPRCW